jgi:hypothetical protein
VLDTYLLAASHIADADVAYVLRFSDRDEVLDAVVVITVLGEAVQGAVRRIAHQVVSARRLGIDAQTNGPVQHQ